MTEPTLKQWRLRALKAEKELESIREMRQFEHSMELKMHREVAAAHVALKEAREVIDWALSQEQL